MWKYLVAELGRDDVVTPQAPGFGCAKPAGFGATKEEYVDWLVTELEKLAAEGPIDLVGHDWGGGFVIRVVSTRPDLVRSWVTDAAGIGDIDFEWHEFAKIWQTPGEGEKFFEDQNAATAEERGTVLEMFGIPHDRAVELAGHGDDVMAESILALYRSAVDVGKEWAPDFRDIPKPGLVLIPPDDPFLKGEGARASATRAGAKVAELQGVGHWWMLQDPAQGARVLEEFWSSLG